MKTDLPYILMIDDDEFFLNDAELELKGKARFKGFQGPNDFELEVTADDIKDADLILVDYEFRGGSATKCKLAQYIREELGYQGWLVLCSLHADHNFGGLRDQLAREYDEIIHKRDLKWSNLRSILEKEDSRFSGAIFRRQANQQEAGRHE